jgi:hypothetical protein
MFPSPLRFYGQDNCWVYLTKWIFINMTWQRVDIMWGVWIYKSTTDKLRDFESNWIQDDHLECNESEESAQDSRNPASLFVSANI